MSIAILAFVIALVLGLIAQFQAQGRDLTAWAVIALAIGLLCLRITTRQADESFRAVVAPAEDRVTL